MSSYWPPGFVTSLNESALVGGVVSGANAAATITLRFSTCVHVVVVAPGKAIGLELIPVDSVAFPSTFQIRV